MFEIEHENKKYILREITYEEIENYAKDIMSISKNEDYTRLDIISLNLKYISGLSNNSLSIDEIKKLPSSKLKELLLYFQSELNLEDLKKN